MRILMLLSFLLLGVPLFGIAGEADVLKVEVEQNGDGYRFRVTVAHADSGWDHYADRWEILGPDDQVLATRILHHPHVHEQPFIRSLSGVEFPEGLIKVTIRAHDSVHGYAGEIVEVMLPESGI